MTTERSLDLAVVVAVEHGAENLPLILAHLNPRAHPDVEIIVCIADADKTSLMPSQDRNVVMLRCPAGSRVPMMWRDGIMHASTTFVALLSAHCIPSRDWIGAALALQFDETDAAVGGWFSNTPGASAMDWAIYLLRYVGFSQPRSVATCAHVAADNAIYRRSSVMQHADLLERGFWEPEFHLRFAAAGLRLRLVTSLEAVHLNRYSMRAFAQQRRVHGRMFGTDRAMRLSAGRHLAYCVASPLIPMLLIAKIESAAVRLVWARQVPWVAHLWLLLFAVHWAYGEAAGVFRALLRRWGVAH